MLNKINTILWDFDGVILDSMSVRDEGFVHTLRGFPEDQVQDLLTYHRKNGGLSRYVKFRYFFESIRNEKVSEEKIIQLSAVFSNYMRENLINKDYLINDSLSFIEQNYRKVSMHIVSGSDQNELRFLCDKLGISHFFKSINGSPTPKNTLVYQVIKQYGVDKATTALIGDSHNDFEAAEVNDISFFGYNNLELATLGNSYIEKFQEG
jgi:phosphoglycolate phosphatase-like HAD superfamily hydrolase